MTVERLPDGLRLLQPAEAPTGLRKSIEILQKPGEPRLILRHELANEGSQPIELAPWAITMLRPGGVAVVPQATDPVDPDGLQPNRSLVLWPRTRWDDPHLHLVDGFVFVECRPIGRPAKIGTFSRQGWLGYRWGNMLFVKRFESKPESPHTDLGCNAAVYVCDEYLELESLGPLCVLAPGATVSHTETWEVYRIEAGAPLPEAYTPALQALQNEPWSAG